MEFHCAGSTFDVEIVLLPPKRLNLNMDNIGKLSEDELKKEVDEAVGNLVTPLKMKSHLITQLKTQIEDLEMFIEFLQGEASTISPGT